MELDEDKVDEAVLALLRLTLHDECRAWKGFDWDALDRLHRKSLVADPVGKAKSVVLTDEGLERSAALLEALIEKRPRGGECGRSDARYGLGLARARRPATGEPVEVAEDAIEAWIVRIESTAAPSE